MKGGLGNDHISCFTNLSLDQGGGLRLNLNGGAGRDRLKVVYEGVLDNPLFLNADGGRDNDNVAVTMAFQLGSDATLGSANDRARVVGRRGMTA